MADNTITHGAPGIAAYDSETWGNATELLLQDTPAPTFKTITLTASGADIDIAINSVIAADGGLAVYTPYDDPDPAFSDAAGITRYPIFVADGDTMDVTIMTSGHVDINALVWHASFTTDALKKTAFSVSTVKDVNFILGANPFNSDGVLA